MHANVAEILFSMDESAKENASSTKCKVIPTDDKQHLAICFDGNTHGLIFANLVRGAKRGHCLKCKSIRCPHLKSWDLELKKAVLTNASTVDVEPSGLDKNLCADETGFDAILPENRIEVTEPIKKLYYPFEEAVQEQLRMLDATDFSDLTEFISCPNSDAKCSHGNNWCTDDPRDHNWVFSTDIKIAHSSFVSRKERKEYFRKTLGSCHCILMYNGADDLFVRSSRGFQCQKSSGHRMGYSVNLVSYSLLTDFLMDFFRNGVTMRGFHMSYSSKCVMKYGMKDNEVISWRAWHQACEEFIINILNINQKEAFSCITCGPRPSALVIDGITMGIQVKELEKYKEDFVKAPIVESKIEFLGSKYRSRMFIKLLSNRQILRKAAHERVWPIPNHNHAADSSDPEFELNRTEISKDPGMERFWRFLGAIDTSALPTIGYILLMKELSAYTSTLALMQIVNRNLAHQLVNFLTAGIPFWRGTENIDIHMQMRHEYPVLMDIILSLSDSEGVIALPIR